MAKLPMRVLGKTGVEVTALGYGAMELRGAPVGPDVPDDEAGRILNTVLDAGINFIDTSIDYGRSEELIGKHIAHRRSEYFLASKCGCVPGAPREPGRPGPHVFTRDNIVAGVEQSLSRLHTDYLDLVQLHASPSREVLEEKGVVDTLLDLKRQGKVRFIGMSGTIPHLADHIAMGVFDEFQIPYSALERDHEALISQAATAGAGIVVRGGAARGVPAEDKPKAGHRWELWERAGLNSLLGDMTRMEFILRFTASHPDAHTNIVGTRNVDHLRANLDAVARGPLPSDIYEEAKRRMGEAGTAPSPVR